MLFAIGYCDNSKHYLFKTGRIKCFSQQKSFHFLSKSLKNYLSSVKSGMLCHISQREFC